MSRSIGRIKSMPRIIVTFRIFNARIILLGVSVLSLVAKYVKIVAKKKFLRRITLKFPILGNSFSHTPRTLF